LNESTQDIGAVMSSWGPCTTHPTRNYKVYEIRHTYIRGKGHCDSDRRLRFNYQQGLFSKALGFIVGPTQSIQ
jgi:hypothetical protein